MPAVVTCSAPAPVRDGGLGRAVHHGEAALAPGPTAALGRGRRAAEGVAQGVADGVEGQHGEGDGRPGRHERPGVGEQGVVVGLAQHGAPVGRRRRGAETQEGQTRLGQQRRAEGDGDLDHQAGHHVGQHPEDHDARRGCADGLRGLDEGLLLDGQGLAPDEAGEARGEDERQGQGHVAHRGAEHGDHGQGEDEGWEGQAGVGAPHEQVVDPPAPIPGHQADDQRQHQGQAHGLEGHLHGDPGAVDEPGEHVAPEIVGPQQVVGARPGVGGEQVLGVRIVGGDEGGEDGGHDDQANQTMDRITPVRVRKRRRRVCSAHQACQEARGPDGGRPRPWSGHDTRTLGLR